MLKELERPRTGWRLAVYSLSGRLLLLTILFVMLSVALAVLTVLTVRNRFDDPDLWWHLKIGQIIWNAHSIPNADAFSFRRLA